VCTVEAVCAHVDHQVCAALSVQLEDGCLLGSTGGSKLLRNVSHYLPDYAVQHPRRQPS
jgi:hypothetical protein